MKKRKPSAVDSPSDARIMALLGTTPAPVPTGSLATAEVDGGTVSGVEVCDTEDEEILDKTFISQDVEKEREVTFADIERRG